MGIKKTLKRYQIWYTSFLVFGMLCGWYIYIWPLRTNLPGAIGYPIMLTGSLAVTTRFWIDSRIMRALIYGVPLGILHSAIALFIAHTFYVGFWAAIIPLPTRWWWYFWGYPALVGVIVGGLGSLMISLAIKMFNVKIR